MVAQIGIGTVVLRGEARQSAISAAGNVYILEDVAEYCRDRGISLKPKASVNDLLADWDASIDALIALGDRIGQGDLSELGHPAHKFHICAPHEPRQVFCTGANYHRHVVDIICDRFGEQKMRDEGLTPQELRQWAEGMMRTRAEKGEPYIFTRIASSYAGPFDDLVIPNFSKEPDWEAELAVVFKSGGHKLSRDTAMSTVAGYMVVNDITSRDQIFTADPKEMGADWLHAKNSPGFFPMGPWIVPACCIDDPHDLRVKLTLNGDVMQDETTADMIFDIPRQIETLSKYVKILPGDVLATGSPAGNGTHHRRFLRAGDVMEASIEGLGAQSTRCVVLET